MRKLLSVTLVLLVGVTFTSCKKDGVFNPKNKINKVFQQPENGSKTLMEEWTWWNDGNTLTNVAYYINDTTVLYKTYYFYEKKQLVKIDNTSDLSYVKITYSGSQYDKIETFDKFDRKKRSYTYTYDGKKVSKIELTVYKNPSKFMDEGDDRILSAFIPREILEETNAQIMNPSYPSKADEDEVIIYMLKFDGDNMSEWKMIDNNNINKPVEITYSYESYDKNLNPYYASCPNIIDGMNVGTFCFYKNNPLKITCTRVDNGPIPQTQTFSYDFVYTYNDKKIPTEAVRKQMYDGVQQALVTYYYEYNK